MKMVAGL